MLNRLLEHPILLFSVAVAFLLLVIIGAIMHAVSVRRRLTVAPRRRVPPPVLIDGTVERGLDIRPPVRAEPTVVMPRPGGGDGVQLLPGRLEVIAGANAGEQIRFMQLKGEPADITLGRADGPAYHHVRLPAQTVSRTHARLQFEDGRWKISNLSHTNPTRVNGSELVADGSTHWLSDGDRIEIGEMVFRFRSE